MNGKALTLILGALAVGICVLGYADILTLGWLGQDSITAVESSRFHDLPEALSLFRGTLMEDTGFIFHYYRPVICLSFGLNYLLCGIHPAGYHLVDLFLFVAIMLCVYCFALWMPRRSLPARYIQFSSFGAALAYSAYTLHLTVIPVVARRSEGQLVLFGLAGLVCILLAAKKKGGRRALCLLAAGLSLTLSTLSKEAGLLFFPPAALLIALTFGGSSPWKKMGLLITSCAALGALGLMLMKIRSAVVGLPAGYSIHPGGYEGLSKSTWDYILTLVYPVRFLGFENAINGRYLPVLLAGIALLALAGSLMVTLFQDSRVPKLLGVLLGATGGAAFLTWLLAGAAGVPYDSSAGVEHLWASNALATGHPLTGFCCLLGLLTLAAGIRRLLTRTSGPPDGLVVLATWLFCAWCLVSLSGLYTFRNSMGPAAAVILLLLLGMDWMLDRFRQPCGRARRTFALLSGAALLTFLTTLFGFSHYLQRYREWHDLDRIVTPYLEGVIDAAEKDGMAKIKEIGLEGVPGRCFFSDRYPKSVALARFVDYTLQSWFTLRLPQAPPVRILNSKQLKDPRDRVRITSRREGDRLVITAHYEPKKE